MICVKLDCAPVAKGRPRMTKTGHTYTPQKTRDAEDMVKILIKDQYKGEPYGKDAPLSLEARFGLQRPKTTKKEQPTGKPDVDNYLKLVMDCGNGIIWEDDSQIVEVIATKYWADEPCIMLLVGEL